MKPHRDWQSAIRPCELVPEVIIALMVVMMVVMMVIVVVMVVMNVDNDNYLDNDGGKDDDGGGNADGGGDDGGGGELVPEVIVGSKLDGLLWGDQQDVHSAPSVHAKVTLIICNVLVLLVW